MERVDGVTPRDRIFPIRVFAPLPLGQAAFEFCQRIVISGFHVTDNLPEHDFAALGLLQHSAEGSRLDLKGPLRFG